MLAALGAAEVVCNVDRKLMVLFYKRSIEESFLTFSLMCWYENLNLQNRNQLGNIVKMAGKIIGEQQLSLSNTFSWKLTHRVNHSQQIWIIRSLKGI